VQELTSEQKVEKITNQIVEKENINRASARSQLHKAVCKGKCNWYKTQSKQAGFDRLDLTEQQEQNIWEIISQVMKDATKDEARREIHAVICHPIPEDA